MTHDLVEGQNRIADMRYLRQELVRRLTTSAVIHSHFRSPKNTSSVRSEHHTCSPPAPSSVQSHRLAGMTQETYTRATPKNSPENNGPVTPPWPPLVVVQTAKSAGHSGVMRSVRYVLSIGPHCPGVTPKTVSVYKQGRHQLMAGTSSAETLHQVSFQCPLPPTHLDPWSPGPPPHPPTPSYADRRRRGKGAGRAEKGREGGGTVIRYEN